MTVDRVKCQKDVDYCSAGHTYEVEQTKRFVYFHNVETGGRTSMPAWAALARALANLRSRT